MKNLEKLDLRGAEEYIRENTESLDLGDVQEYKHDRAIGTSTFRSFVMTEKADEAYNSMMTNWICKEIKSMMDEIYIAKPTGARSCNKIELIRKGGGGAYQFEIKINSDGTLTVADNSLARGFTRTLDDGTKKFIMVNTKEYFRTQKTGQKAVEELVEWLVENYDKYDEINAAAKDRRNGINSDVARRDGSTRTRGPKRATTLSQKYGITDIVSFLRNGGNIKDLV